MTFRFSYVLVSAMREVISETIDLPTQEDAVRYVARKLSYEAVCVPDDNTRLAGGQNPIIFPKSTVYAIIEPVGSADKR